MTDPVLEAIAELVFADQLVDVDEIETLSEDAWLSAYQKHHQLDSSALTTRLMTAHDDPAVDEQALQQLVGDDKEALLKLLTDLTVIDDHHDPREVAVLTRMASALRLHHPPLERRLEEARTRTSPLRTRLSKPLPRPRKRVRLLRRADRWVGQVRIDSWASRFAQQGRLRRWRRETFFNHKAYRRSLDQMHQLTLELMPHTQEVLQDATTTLEVLQEQFKAITTALVAQNLPKESEEQLTSLLNEVRERLDRLVQKDLEELRKDLLAKQRSLNRFCMAAVGRTRAGKSTLIATLTGRDQGAIGDGRQGFTRFNRAYNFNGIRLIDTPGFGAAGGQGENFEAAEARDSNVARNIFPETDLICFVIDNDSTVPCTRELMRELHQRGKAFLILLNVKASLQGGLKLLSSRLASKFAKEGEQSISGNIAAIRRDLANAIGVKAAQAVPIIPIHAKAAFKAKHVADSTEAEHWRELSRLDQFLEQLDDLITLQAPQLRRRTLRANPRRELERIAAALSEVEQSLLKQASIFGETEESSTKKVVEIFTDLNRSLRIRIEDIFKKLEVEAKFFSADHYRRSGTEIERRWQKVLESFNLSGKVDDEVTWLKSELIERIEELQQDIHAKLQFQVGTISLQHRLAFDFDITSEEVFRRYMNISIKLLAGFLGPALWALGAVAWPVSLAIFAASMIPAALDWLLPNAQERRREAQNTLKIKLLEGLKEPRIRIDQQFEEILQQQHDQVSTALHQGLGGSSAALLAFQKQLVVTCDELHRQAQRLD